MKYVVHNKRADYDIYIGRQNKDLAESKWHNPFSMKSEADRDTVIQQYREWLHQQPKLMLALPELQRKRLGCWCAPKACHGDVLSLYANGHPDYRRVLVAGSRSYKDYLGFKDYLLRFLPKDKKPIIVTGMAPGPDRFAYEFAKVNKLDYMPIKADWDEYGKSAGYRRNAVMAKLCDEAIIFWDGKSKGTKNMMDLCKEKRITTKIIMVTPTE